MCQSNGPVHLMVMTYQMAFIKLLSFCSHSVDYVTAKKYNFNHRHKLHNTTFKVTNIVLVCEYMYVLTVSV